MSHLIRIWGGRLVWLLAILLLVSGVVLMPNGLSWQESKPRYTIEVRRDQIEGPVLFEVALEKMDTVPLPVWQKFKFSKFAQSYTEYWQGLLTANLTVVEQKGIVEVTEEIVDVDRLVWQAGTRSVGIFFGALLLGVVGGLLLSILGLRLRWFAAIPGTASLAAMTVPDFLLIQLGWMLTAWTWRKFDIKAFPVMFSEDAERAWLFPVLMLAVLPMGYVARLVKLAMEETLQEDYVRTMRSIGLSDWRIFFTHALKNALPRIIDGLPTVMNLTLCSLVVIEMLYWYPGLGSMLGTSKFLEIRATAILLLTVWYIVLDGIVQSVRFWSNPLLKGGA